MNNADEIRRVLDLYTFVVDASEWDRLAEVMTADAEFVVRGTPVSIRGLDDIAALLQRVSPRPLAHLTTNVLLDDETTSGMVRARSKVFTPKPDGTAGIAMYEDTLIRTPNGWRINSHIVEQIARAWPGGL